MKTPIKQVLKSIGLIEMMRSVRNKYLAIVLDTQMVKFYKKFIKPGDLCFDVGANIGNRTRIFRKLGARVIAVEPQSYCYNILNEKFGSDSNIVLLKKGLSNRTGSATLATSSETPVVSTLSVEFKEKWRFASSVQWDGEETIQLSTLDELVRTYGTPAFCKIDVEGHEESVLLGLSSPIKTLSYEFNLEFLDKAEVCLRRLEAIGFSEFAFSEGESMELACPWVDANSLIESLRESRNPLFWGDIYARTPLMSN